MSNDQASATTVERDEASRPQRINIPGIRLDRQRDEPASHLVCVQPARMRERLALSQRRIVTGEAERLATLDAGERHVALDRGKFKGQCRDRLGQSMQGLRLVAL